jgi:hypothetical protein
MATSETDLCNLALAHLGEAPIVSLDEDSAASRACLLQYAPTRDAALPADCLRVLEFNGSESGDVISDEYVIESGKLLTDEDTAEIVFIRRVLDVGLFDPLFVKALALALAIELSETIRGTTGKTAELQQAFQSLVAPLARRVDANEGKRRKGLLPLNSLFVRARGEGV